MVHCLIPEANRLHRSSLFREPEPKMEPDSGEASIVEDPIQHIKLKRPKSEFTRYIQWFKTYLFGLD